jgi:cyclophilin family peptidyl-prolyl cis-trans isomerase
MDIATTVMPETTQNFLDLCRADTEGYTGSILYRFEKGVGICGGDVLTNTGKSGKAANGNPLAMDISTDPLALWHLEGTVTMLVAKVGQVDSRFVLCTDTAPHLDGINRAFGRLTEESIEVLKNWQATLLTKNGAPTSVDLVVVEAGVLGENTASEQAA